MCYSHFVYSYIPVFSYTRILFTTLKLLKVKPAIEAINTKYGGGADHPIERITCQYRLANRANLQEYVLEEEGGGYNLY